MKWSISRLKKAPHAPRRPDGSSAAPRSRPSARETQLPHRSLALRALRQLARGHLLVIGGQSALGVRLAGVPDVVHLADDLIERGLVERVEVAECGAPCYALSEAGLDTLRRGERWWREMNPFQRLIVEFTG
ncbi:MAG: hypothetical protein ACM3SS_18820 [Rhodospirillaceae bacterium]